MDLNKLREYFARGNNSGPGNPYEVNITRDELFRGRLAGDSQYDKYVKCEDCDAIVLKENAIERPEDYVCLWCENEEWKNS